MTPTAAVSVLFMVITSVGGSGAPAAGGGSAASPTAAAAALLRQQQELEIRGLLDACSDDCGRCILSSAQACLDGCPSLKTRVTCFVDQIPILKECLRSGSGSGSGSGAAPPASVVSQVQVMLPGGSAASPPTALLQQQQKFELRDLLDTCSFFCWNCLFASVLPCGFSALFCGNPLSSAVTCVAQQIPTMEGCLRGN